MHQHAFCSKNHIRLTASVYQRLQILSYFHAMRRMLILSIIAITCVPCSSQLFDDFSDGNINSNPAWTGHVDHFIVNSDGMLQLQAPEAGSSQLCTPVSYPDSVVWELFFRMDFAPSASNRIRIYLMTDTTMSGEANGYFLAVGSNGSEDPLDFYALEDGTEMLIASSPGIFGGDPSVARLRIIRTAGGRWTVLGDPDGGGQLQNLITFDDQTFSPTGMRYFCLKCIYSETRRDKFFFDDISISPLLRDTVPPLLQETAVTDMHTLSLLWDEPLNSATAENAGLFSVDQGIGTAAISIQTGPDQVTLTFDAPFQSGISYTLEVRNMQDTAGNVQVLQTDTFVYYDISTAMPFDILINEIMADPNPALGLPEEEYIELHNRSTRTFDLEQYLLQVGSSTRTLPAYLFEAGGYALLVDEDDAPLFAGYPHVVAVDGLPGLTNSGAEITLLNASGDRVHRVEYTDAWYRDPAKDDGGWSIELINPETPCALDENWQASEDLRGGTPGEENSVLDLSVEDTTGPTLMAVFPISDEQLRLQFDEVLSTAPPSVTLDPFIAVADAEVVFDEVFITLAEPMEEGILYRVQTAQIADCTGNISDLQSLSFARPAEVDPGDLLINELLFDPQTRGSAFVELYNASQKYLASSDLILADIRGDTIDAEAVDFEFLIAPGSYLAIAPDRQDVIARYPTSSPPNIIQSAIPSLDREAGNITVYTSMGIVADAFDYDETMHNPFVDDTKGVSLERISIATATSSPDNWQSAAATVGYATPGLPNSQRQDLTESESVFTIENRTFSPDGDGFADFMLIHFTDPPAGALVTIRIFDAHGRQVARPLNNETVSAGAIATWDGATEEGDKLPVGIYIALIEMVLETGIGKTYKEAVVLATRL